MVTIHESTPSSEGQLKASVLKVPNLGSYLSVCASMAGACTSHVCVKMSRAPPAEELELNNNAGFSVAFSLLIVGSKVCGNYANIVVRHKLKDMLLEQIGNAWDEIKVVDAVIS